MVIGNGMLAKEFTNYIQDSNILIFASGVSNSNETSFEAFQREEKLLLDSIEKEKGKKLIYFSTCSMYDKYFKNNAYTEHKLNMEKKIQELSKNYMIFRLPQVLGLNNKYQLMGFLYQKIKNNEEFELFNIERNIIDIKDVKIIIDFIIKNNLFKNKIINVANKNNIKVIDLVKILEKLLGKQGNYKIIDKIGSFNIDINDIMPIIHKFELFKINYMNEKVTKYYE